MASNAYAWTALVARGSVGARAAEHKHCAQSMAQPDLPWRRVYHNGYALVKHLFCSPATWENQHAPLPEGQSLGKTPCPLRWTPVSRPIYGQSKLSVKGSLQGCWSLRTLLLNGRHLLPYRLMDNSAPSHSRRLWVW